jgi:hypothetical protein
MKKTLCLTHKVEPHASLFIQYPEYYDKISELELSEEKFDEIIADYAHLIAGPDFMQTMYNLLTDDGVLDITVPKAGTPCSFEDPFTTSFWREETFLYYQLGTHSLRRKEYGPTLRCAFSIDIGATQPDAKGSVWIRARCTKVPMEKLDG